MMKPGAISETIGPLGTGTWHLGYPLVRYCGDLSHLTQAVALKAKVRRRQMVEPQNISSI